MQPKLSIHISQGDCFMPNLGRNEFIQIHVLNGSQITLYC